MITGFGHKAGVGKSTCADMLADRGFIKKSFASGIKEEVWSFLKFIGVDVRYRNLHGSQESKNETFSTPSAIWELRAPKLLQVAAKDVADYSNPGLVTLSYRQLLQLWGTGYRRKQDRNYWIKKMQSSLKHRNYIVIDDVRFQNEVDMIHKLGGIVVRVDNSRAEKLDHESEKALDEFSSWDAVISNESSLEALRQKVLSLIEVASK